MWQQTTVGQSKKKQSSIPVASKSTKVRPKVPCNCKNAMVSGLSQEREKNTR